MIFFQVQMYADMFLQVYFFFISLYGWWKWKHPRIFEQTLTHELKITVNGWRSNFLMVFGIAVGFVALGTFIKNLHILLPQWFELPATFPYFDSLVAVCSIVAMYLLARKKLESWVLWIIVDGICIVLFYLKGIKLISFEYAIFLMIASYGLWSWWKEYKGYHEQNDLERLRLSLAERC